VDQRLYWADKALLDPFQAVLDYRDKKGKKNLFIHKVHTISLKPYMRKGRVLDFGCGTGRMGKEFAGKSLLFIGCDITEEMLRCARKQFPCTLFDGRHLPFKKKSFDYFLSVYVLQHIEDVESVLDEAVGILRKGAYFLAIEQVCNIPYRVEEKGYLRIVRTPEQYKEYICKRLHLLQSHPVRVHRMGIFNLLLDVIPSFLLPLLCRLEIYVSRGEDKKRTKDWLFVAKNEGI
jgi:ubiquinone/menaquinone biosynthesis C-methylase UbiE